MFLRIQLSKLSLLLWDCAGVMYVQMYIHIIFNPSFQFRSSFRRVLEKQIYQDYI